MKTVFILNSKAGSGKDIDKLTLAIKNVAYDNNLETQIYFTKAVGDATRFVREYCIKEGAARFIACGGDGTFGEVLNGIWGCKGAQIGVIPIGTGNDFCRNFEGASFFDITHQICGKTDKCDAIRCTIMSDGCEKVIYCANMINIGFDCNVADMTASIKQKPLISGPFAYFVSIFAALAKKDGADLHIEIDDEQIHQGKLLLTSVANGSFCGGGIKSNPLACVQDGFININIINNISRLKFIFLLPSYMKGTFLKKRNIEKIISSRKCKKVLITPKENSIKISIDGEILPIERVQFEIVPKAFEFVVPKSGQTIDIKTAKEVIL